VPRLTYRARFLVLETAREARPVSEPATLEQDIPLRSDFLSDIVIQKKRMEATENGNNKN
jgi:hypothetical protein